MINKKFKNKSDDVLHTPCSIAEAVQIARGVAEDVVADYQRQQAPLQVVTSLQIESLKEALIAADIIDEEKYRDIYMKKVDEFNAEQQKRVSESAKVKDNSIPMNPDMSLKSEDIEVTTKE